MQSKLAEYTRKRLQSRSRVLHLQHIADQTGLTYDWLIAFGNDRIANPSVQKVETLFEFLTGIKIMAALTEAHRSTLEL